METTELLRQRIEQFAVELRAEFGEIPPDAQGCLLLAVEDWAVEVGDHLSRAVVHDQLAQVPVPVELPCCPRCQQPASRQKERKRRVETRRGPVRVTEPECYCNRCRRSFFPSDPPSGNGA